MSTRMDDGVLIPFRDFDAVEDAFVIVKVGAGKVAITISVRNTRDIEVLMEADKAALVVEALLSAIAQLAPLDN